MSSVACKVCNDPKVIHPCWKHSKQTAGCRMSTPNWAPSRCRECINAAAKMAAEDRSEAAKAFEAYKPFLKGFRSFVERVCNILASF